jgi:hypothetical protein
MPILTQQGVVKMDFLIICEHNFKVFLSRYQITLFALRRSGIEWFTSIGLVIDRSQSQFALQMSSS